MRKFKLFVDFEEEEKWLQDLAKEGWIFQKKGFFYKFEKGEPKDFIYAVDYQDYMNKEEYINYLTLFEDFGWSRVVGSRLLGEQYFIKTKKDGDASIFSDRESSAKRYRKKGIQSLITALTFIFIFIPNVINPELKSLNWVLHPKSTFLTPGIWERTGSAFWSAFFFELPFAGFRFLSIFIIIGNILLFIIYGIWLLKLEKEKRGAKNEE